MLVTQRRPLMVDLDDFSGGLNVRDGYSEVAANEFQDGTLNWTLDERAAITSRKGCPAAADFPALPGNPSTVFYSFALGLMIAQVGTGLYKCAPGGGSWTLFRTQGSSFPCAFCDFTKKLCIAHPVDGLLVYDGTAAPVLGAAISCTMVASWQNKLFVAGDTTNPEQMWWSALGDPLTWTTATDTQRFREKDMRPLTALFGGPTLLAFKETSHYRVNDPSNGAFTTVDWNVGAVGPRAVIGGVAPQASGLIQEGGIFFWGPDGLYAGDGLRPAILVGDKLHPRFTNYSKLNATTKPLISAGVANGRIYFGFPKTSTTQPDTILEYHPRDKWLLEHQVGSAKPLAFATYSSSTTTKTLIANAVGASLIELLTSDTRTDYDGSGVALTLKTGFISIAEGRLVRMRKAVFTLFAGVASSVTFVGSYVDSYDGTEKTTGLSWGTVTMPQGTSAKTWNATALAPAFAFTLTASGVAIVLRRVLATFYPAEN